MRILGHACKLPLGPKPNGVRFPAGANAAGRKSNLSAHRHGFRDSGSFLLFFIAKNESLRALSLHWHAPCGHTDIDGNVAKALCGRQSSCKEPSCFTNIAS
jgi:hypothetical protein